jgi:alpha-mannosidase
MKTRQIFKLITAVISSGIFLFAHAEPGISVKSDKRNNLPQKAKKDTIKKDLAFPNDIECVPQLFYRYRKDGKPGRELLVNFKGSKLNGSAFVDVIVEGKTETTEILPSNEGYEKYEILLPEKVSVQKEASVSLTLRQGKKTITKQLNVPPMRHWNIYLYNHSHVDIGYTNTQKNVEILHKNNIIEGIKLAEETKDYPKDARFCWNPEITWPIERLIKSNPELQSNLVSAVRKNYLGVDASYLNLNTSVCTDEELFHAFSFSRKIQKLSGVPIDVFQQIDVPGISWGILPVLAQEGIRYVMAWPNTDRAGNAHKQLDKQPQWWIGPDGKSKVLFFQPGQYANSGSLLKGAEIKRPWFAKRNPADVPLIIKTGKVNIVFEKELLDLEAQNYKYDFLVLSWSLWDNSTLDGDIPNAVKDWNEKYAYPHIIISGGHQIMEMIEKKYGDQLPIVKGDYTEYWTDGLGSSAALTAISRNTNERLIQTETLLSMLKSEQTSPREELDEAWRYTQLGSEHTWCFENPLDTFFQDTIWRVKKSYFLEAKNRTNKLYYEALGKVKSASNQGISVYNTHSWLHSGLITLSPSESAYGSRVFDDKENEVLTQRLSSGELVFLASDIPAFSSRFYRLEKGNCKLKTECKILGNTLINQHLQVSIDPVSGNITQLSTIKNGRNFADPKVNGGLNAFRWIPANIDAPKADSNVVISVVESGPLVVEMNVKSKGIGCRSISRSVRLVARQPWVEISNIVDKLPLKPKDGIHFGFGFDIPDGKTRVDIPWGVMEVEKDQLPQGNRNWLALQRWLDISNDKEGVTWCSLDAPVFEYGKMSANIALSWGGQGPWITKLEPSSTIYSWVMNNHWHTNFPLTQEGPVTFRYRILPHGNFDQAMANRFGLEQSQPLVHALTDKDRKIVPFVALDNDKVYVTILKQKGDGKSTIIRLRSLSDKPENVKLTLPNKVAKSIRICKVSEEPSDLMPETISMLPYGSVTLHVEF